MILNRIFFSISLPLGIIIMIFLSSCANWKIDRMTPSSNKELSQKIVSERLAVWSKGKTVYIDPLLKERLTIFNKNEFQNASEIYPGLLFTEKKSYIFSYIIPDTLSTVVKYKDVNADIENGPNTYLFFSPLLTTRKKDVFTIQVYKLETVYNQEVSIRLAERYYELFAKKGNVLQYLETVSSEEDVFSLPFPIFHKD